MSEGSLFQSFSVYPNPAAVATTLVFTLKQPAETQLFLRNQLGQTLWTGTIVAREGLNAVNVPLEGVKPGSYFLGVQLGEEIRTERLVKF